MDTATIIEMREAAVAKWQPVIAAEQTLLQQELEALVA